MRIAPHQIHNVLKAYAKRLKNVQDSINNGGAPPTAPDPDACSAEDKRRLIVSKISPGMIERMLLNRQKPGLETDSSQTPETRPRDALPTNRFPYQTITPTGEKITVHMEIEDPDFLLNQMEPASHNPEEAL